MPLNCIPSLVYVVHVTEPRTLYPLNNSSPAEPHPWLCFLVLEFNQKLVTKMYWNSSICLHFPIHKSFLWKPIVSKSNPRIIYSDVYLSLGTEQPTIQK